jgi:glycerol-3-phosphate cytidylyltransferase
MKKGILFGTFDVWHAGYAMMVEEAKRHCDYLIVGLQTEHSRESKMKKYTRNVSSPVNERFLVLKSIHHIDEVAIYTTEDELENLLDFYKPDCRFLGDDYKDVAKSQITGYFKSGEVIFIKRDHGISTTKFKERIADDIRG